MTRVPVRQGVELLDRVYADDRVLIPRPHRGEGAGRSSAARVGRGARSWSHRWGPRSTRATGGTETVLPYSYMGTMGTSGKRDAGALLQALGATLLVRTIWCHGGLSGVVFFFFSHPRACRRRSIRSAGPAPATSYAGAGTDVDRAHLWRFCSRRAGGAESSRSSFRPEPARACRTEPPAAAPGRTPRRAGDDARDRSTPACTTRRGAGARHRHGRLLRGCRSSPWKRCDELCGVPAETIARIGRDVRHTRRRSLRLVRRRSAAMGRAVAYRSGVPWPGAERSRGGSRGALASYLDATSGALDSSKLIPPDPRAGPVPADQPFTARRSLTDPALAPPDQPRSSASRRQPGGDRPRTRRGCSPGAAPGGPVLTVVARASS
jgi:hypothetical protein